MSATTTKVISVLMEKNDRGHTAKSTSPTTSARTTYCGRVAKDPPAAPAPTLPGLKSSSASTLRLQLAALKEVENLVSEGAVKPRGRRRRELTHRRARRVQAPTRSATGVARPATSKPHATPHSTRLGKNSNQKNLPQCQTPSSAGVRPPRNKKRSPTRGRQMQWR